MPEPSFDGFGTLGLLLSSPIILTFTTLEVLFITFKEISDVSDDPDLDSLCIAIWMSVPKGENSIPLDELVGYF